MNDDNPFAARIHRAKVLMDTFRWELAAAEFRACLELDPDSAEAHAHLALCLGALDDFNAAQEHILQAITRQSDCAQFHYFFSLILSDSGNLTGAEKSIKTAIGLDPSKAEYHAQEGHLALMRNRPKMALKCAAVALSLDPTHANTLALLALASLFARKFKRAKKYAEELARIAPNSGVTHFVLGLVEERTGSFLKAVAHLREASRLRPEAAHIQFALFWVMANRKEFRNPYSRGYDVQPETIGQKLSTFGNPQMLVRHGDFFVADFNRRFRLFAYACPVFFGALAYLSWLMLPADKALHMPFMTKGECLFVIFTILCVVMLYGALTVHRYYIEWNDDTVCGADAFGIRRSCFKWNELRRVRFHEWAQVFELISARGQSISIFTAMDGFSQLMRQVRAAELDFSDKIPTSDSIAPYYLSSLLPTIQKSQFDADRENEFYVMRYPRRNIVEFMALGLIFLFVAVLFFTTPVLPQHQADFMLRERTWLAVGIVLLFALAFIWIACRMRLNTLRWNESVVSGVDLLGRRKTFKWTELADVRRHELFWSPQLKLCSMNGDSIWIAPGLYGFQLFAVQLANVIADLHQE